MKKLNLLTITFILLFVAKGFAQDWNVIKPDAIAYYQGSDSIVLAIRIDSTCNYGDSVDYFNYHYVRPIGDIYNNCYTIKGASWLGERVRYRNNGICTFYNYQNKPIIINTKAQLGESWQLFNYTDGSYIEATVTQADSISFLSLRDSVKTISLQLKNDAGININSTNPSDSSYIINHSILRLSKNYGLISALHFFQFPYVTQSAIYPELEYVKNTNIIGLSNPVVGYQNITAREIFDFEVGDEFHFNINAYSNFFMPFVHQQQQIDKIISKSISENNDTIEFLIESCIYSIYEANGQVNIVNISDSLHSQKIIFSSSDLLRMNNLNYEPYQKYDYWTYLYSKVKSKTIIDETYLFIDNGFCLSLLCVDGSTTEEYYEGRGGPYWISSGFFGEYSEKKLIYYKKGSLEWGTPFDCLTLEQENLKNANIIIVYPNPASNTINIELPQNNIQKYKISFCNLQGKILMQKTLNNSETIDISNFTEGVYILKIETKNFIETKKIIVVK